MTVARASRPRGWPGVVAAISALVACGAPQRTGDGTAADPPVGATGGTALMGTPLEQRPDAACDLLGPKLTRCAVEDARADLAAGKIDRAQFERDTAQPIQRKNTEDFLATCKKSKYSSRQVRVLEVGLREEQQCVPLLDCLGHLSDRAAPKRP